MNAGVEYLGPVPDLVAVCAPAGVYLFKVNSGNTRTMCDIFLK